MARLYGEKESINSDKVKNFFNKRANKDVDSNLSIVLFQDKENSEKRNIEETNLFLENIDLKNKKVLEIGCGLGRWAEFFHDKCESYLGLDYSENLIEIAKETNNYDNCNFQVMSAYDIKIDELLIKPPFDVLLISQMLMYINDDDILTIINEINEVLNEDRQIFITEPISCMDSRLTLKDFYSDKLEEDYNAIYRTEGEYIEFFKKLNCKKITTHDIFMDSNKQTETQYKSFVMK
ncbi:MAG: class I SAM-dependent methyltransferase [Methanobrevibacter thaueri]|nr:class I SAM-dependent methyltransferase [Methanobrevibacter thaueri]